MQRLTIDLRSERDDSYEIIIGEGLLSRAGEYISHLDFSGRVIILSDSSVADIYLKPLQKSLVRSGIECDSVIFEGGESAKTLEHYAKLAEALLAKRLERRTLLIALGGGICGDLCGFLAATLLRSVPFVQIPTSLLAQVDSAVGGKTGLNSASGKNLIGAFYQPLLVLCDTSLLGSLPERQLRAGYAEILKYALIQDEKFFSWLEDNGEAIIDLSHPNNKEATNYAVHKSCVVKAEIVAADETEQGKRALLNLGHSFAHALEACRTHDDELFHGEAVAIGLDIAFRLSAQLNLCPQSELSQLQNHLQKLQLATIPQSMKKRISHQTIIEKMKTDKKISKGNIKLILAEKIGKAFIAENINQSEISNAIQQYLKGH